MDELALQLLSATPEEMSDLQRVFESAPRYSHLLTGGPVGPAEAQSVFSVLPDGKSYEDKFVFGVYANGVMVGCIDLIRHFPNETTAHIGLLLITEQAEGRGLGTRAYDQLEHFIRSWPSITSLRLGVLQGNTRALSFWSKLGFELTGESKPYQCGSVTSRILVCTKPLPLRAA